MDALMMTGPSQGADRTEVHEIGTPRPGQGEVTIDVAYAGINFLDVMARRGDAGYVGAWPYAPGLEVSGTVREVGRDVTGLAAGQRVAAFTAGEHPGSISVRSQVPRDAIEELLLEAGVPSKWSRKPITGLVQLADLMLTERVTRDHIVGGLTVSALCVRYQMNSFDVIIRLCGACADISATSKEKTP